MKTFLVIFSCSILFLNGCTQNSNQKTPPAPDSSKPSTESPAAETIPPPAEPPAPDTPPQEQQTGDIETSKPVSDNNEEKITLIAPDIAKPLKSPLKIKGKAPGNYFFEATFPIIIQDKNGKTIGNAIAQANGDWMTEDYIEFSAELTFSKPETKTGMLIFANDNPSDLPENAKSEKFEVKFE